ncbi:oxidoreductase [Pusillimonas caeni]|uniref:PDR/VanB family oxidoreductase n=1 Tax=Pusillimonas caeni TaxID=1348472 RepID=UPI000E59F44B|nr:PDR/VanB family oxidoreductase [Pusillimonas caeni]TFL15038.1 oxidoreductase [Pusillimonas caeni]
MLHARIHSITYTAEGVLLFELRTLDGAAMAPFEPGAHIDIHMPGGLCRSYSLLNDSSERHRYVVGIQKDAKSRGGSRWMHEFARVGSVMSISPPKNDFRLDEQASHSVFIAGGIGITPLWCMIQRLDRLGLPWTLYYGARSRNAAALLDLIDTPKWADRVHLHFDDESGGRHLDIPRMVACAPDDSHFYCCGPGPMLEAYQEACSAIAPARVHLEYFATTQALATEGGYTVRLARSDRSISVPQGQTILDALRLAGVDVPSSCQQGVCGMCETPVLAGIPDHRDLVLSQDEKEANTTMMICCSGSLTSELTLDL